MKRRLSTIALSALAVVAVGGLTVLRSGLVAGAAWRHEYTPLTRNTYPVNGTFTNISVTDYYADVQFRVSRDGAVSVVTRDADSVEHTVEVVGGTLTISRPELTAGQRLFHHEDDDPEITVYLPAGNYGALSVSTTSGDIELYGAVSGKVNCNTTSGDVELRCPTAGDVTINSTSGDAELADSYIQSLNVLTVSGDVDLERTVAAGAIVAETTSGDIDLERADAASLTLTTTSGEVEGSLLSAKNFAVSSTMGRVMAPNADPAAGPCTVTTMSGDIRLAVRP